MNNMVITGVPKQANIKQITCKILNNIQVQIQEDEWLEGFKNQFKKLHVKQELSLYEATNKFNDSVSCLGH